MKVKKFLALVSAVILLTSTLSACSGSADVELETNFKVEEVTEKEATTVVEGKKFVVKTNDGSGVNLRAGAGTEFDVLTTIADGHTVMILDQQGSWAQVNYGGYTGWVNMDYLNEITTSATEVETKSPSSSSSPSAGENTSSTSGYLYSYAGFNPTEITIDDSSWNLTLLNRHHTLPEGYVPQLAEAVKGSGVYLDYRVAPHYQEMYDAALAEGITLTPNSGYRSYQTQKNSFENKINYYVSQGYDKATAAQTAATIVLLPGTSEHNAGFAMDIGWVTDDFGYSPAFAWLQENAHNYGFILRYPADEAKKAITEIIYEPWHWRYVGVEAATEMKASGQVLEEYLGKVN